MRKKHFPVGRWIALVVIGAALFAAYHWLDRHPQHNPFAPFTLDQPTGWATQKKLAVFVAEPDACFAALRAGGVKFERLPTIGTGYCLADQRTRITRWPGAPAPIRPAGAAPSCAVGAALLLWQRDVVQPMARLHLGKEVRSIEHLGSYNCRNIRGGRTPSEHASGNAIDIATFVLADGARVSLIDHWDARDGRSAFLRSVRDGGCGYFTTVLSPDYNAAHADHLHLDQAQRPGNWGVCR